MSDDWKQKARERVGSRVDATMRDLLADDTEDQEAEDPRHARQMSLRVCTALANKCRDVDFMIRCDLHETHAGPHHDPDWGITWSKEY